MLTFILMIVAAGDPATGHDMTVLSGRCEYPAGIGEPLRGEHLYACQSVVITPGSDPDGILVQFVDRSTGRLIGFGGDIVDDTMSVRRIYIRSGVKVEATSGHCRLFFRGEKISGVSCVGRADRQTYVANFVAG